MTTAAPLMRGGTSTPLLQAAGAVMAVLTGGTGTAWLAAAGATMVLTAAEAVGAQGPRAVVEVPLRVEGGRLVVTAHTSDGHPVDIGISTANPVTVLSETAAEHFGATGSLRLGSIPLNMDAHRTVPDADLSSDGLRLMGLVGSNTLADHDVLVDAPGGRLILKEVGPGVSWDDVSLGAPQRLRVLHGVALGFDVQLAGTRYGATLDLGTSRTLINEPVGRGLELSDGDLAPLRVGTADLGEVTVRLSDHVLFRRWDPVGEGFVVVGSEIAHGCALSLSWVHQELRSCVR